MYIYNIHTYVRTYIHTYVAAIVLVGCSELLPLSKCISIIYSKSSSYWGTPMTFDVEEILTFFWPNCPAEQGSKFLCHSIILVGLWGFPYWIIK